jgi:membrane protein implicated in regulation of membrane protease activity
VQSLVNAPLTSYFGQSFLLTRERCSLSWDVVTETPPDDEIVREGPDTAAYDFEQARVDVSETQRAIRAQERSRRHSWATAVIVWFAEVIVVAALYLTRLPSAPIRLDLKALAAIDAAAALAGAALLYRTIRLNGQKTKSIDGLRHTLMQHRTAERDAKSRMSIGSDRLLWTYHSDVLDTIDEYRDRALRYRRVHNRFQNIIII